jgi:hypothetical protein
MVHSMLDTPRAPCSRFSEFFSKEGRWLGDKQSLMQILHGITGIAVPALEGTSMDYFTVDERMSWAEGRNTR